MQWEGKLPHDEEVWFRYDVCFGPVILENMKRMNQLAKILTSLWLSIQISLLWFCISMEGWRKWTGKEETATKELLERLSVRPPFWMLHLRKRSPATSPKEWPSDSHVISWWSQVRKHLFGHAPGQTPANQCIVCVAGVWMGREREFYAREKLNQCNEFRTYKCPILHLHIAQAICPPKFCITFVFHFSWVLLPWVPEVFLACGGNFRCWPKANTSSAKETGNRARKVSGTQGRVLQPSQEKLMGVNKKHFGRCASDETQAVARQTGDWLGLRGGGREGVWFSYHGAIPETF